MMRPTQLRLLVTIFLLIFLLLPALMACGRGDQFANAPLDSNAVAVAAAQTLQAQSIQLTLQAQSALLTAQAGGQSPAAPVAGSGSPVISASVDTNCRSGAGAEFSKVSYLGAGKQSIVLGTEPSGNWWLIANPQDSSQSCWVWAETTTVTGEAGFLPVVEGGSASQPPAQEPPAQEPPPQAPPADPGYMSATVKFSSIVVCKKASWAIFEVANTSSLWIKSTNTVLQESGSHRALGETRSNRPFLQAPQGCPPGVTDLKAGSQGYFPAKFTQAVDVNDSIDATITLCSEADQVGKCTSVLVQFSIPAAMPQPPGPPPAENMALQVNFSNIHQCEGHSYATYEIVNNGNVAATSIDVELTNLATHAALGHTYGDGMFVSTKNGCARTHAPLAAGTNGFIPAILDTEKISVGQPVEASIKLCSQEGLAGICTTILVQFTYQ